MTGQCHSYGWATHWGARPSQSEWVFPHKRALLDRNTIENPVRQMWRSWAGMVTRGLWLRPGGCTAKFSKMTLVEKLTFSYLATALLDIPAVSMPIAHSIKTWDICLIALCDKTAHFRVAFYFPQHKAHLCKSMPFNQLLDMPDLQVDIVSWQMRNAHRDVKVVHKIEK